MYRPLRMIINELFIYVHTYVAHTSFIQVVTCFNCKKYINKAKKEQFEAVLTALS